MRIKMERRRYVSSRSIQETGVRFAMLSVAGLLVAASGWAQVPRITLAGVEPGTLVDYSYTIETLRPIMPGDFNYGWRVTMGPLTRRSRYLVDAPAGLALRIAERNLPFPRRTSEAHGRRVYEW